ncbi:MAG: restriction endonuclease [Candidatus Helarchaeota archaeon]|nr:restriction endonuclease [Candidatus Helarchaeota archaeon]
MWRDEFSKDDNPKYDLCIYCNTTMLHSDEKVYTLDGELDRWKFKDECPLCGWRACYRLTYFDRKTGFDPLDGFLEAIIRNFDISDSSVALDEVGSHLKANYSGIYSLSPRRFEELVCDIFKRHGEVASLTKATKDEGVDIYLFKPTGGSWCIIECKKYHRHRKVGIQAIDRLYGVQLAFDIKKAKLVTTSTFSKFAKQRVTTSKASRYGFKIDLIAADDLLKLLDVYNCKLPPLSKLNQKDLEEIIKNNKEIYDE